MGIYCKYPQNPDPVNIFPDKYNGILVPRSAHSCSFKNCSPEGTSPDMSGDIWVAGLFTGGGTTSSPPFVKGRDGGNFFGPVPRLTCRKFPSFPLFQRGRPEKTSRGIVCFFRCQFLKLTRMRSAWNGNSLDVKCSRRKLPSFLKEAIDRWRRGLYYRDDCVLSTLQGDLYDNILRNGVL